MQRIFFCLMSIAFASAVGCGSNSALNSTASKERAATLAKEVREAMTEPSLMGLDPGRMADSGLQGIRQREAALPKMRKLLECGKNAEEPIWQLISDADVSVQRSSVILLGRMWLTEALKPIDSKTLLDVSIPLLERSLASKDAQVRCFACAGLGDFATYSDDCLERLKLSMPKLRELKNDGNEEVRRVCWFASNNIAATLASRAKQPADREAASRELEQLQREKEWQE